MPGFAHLVSAWRGVRFTCRETARRWRTGLVVLGITTALAAVAGLFLAAGLYLYLAGHFAAWQAAAITGVVLTLVAALVAAVPKLRSRPDRPPAGAGAREAEAVVDALFPGRNLTGRNLIVTGLLAGVVLGLLSEQRSQSAGDSRRGS